MINVRIMCVFMQSCADYVIIGTKYVCGSSTIAFKAVYRQRTFNVRFLAVAQIEFVLKGIFVLCS